MNKWKFLLVLIFNVLLISCGGGDNISEDSPTVTGESSFQISGSIRSYEQFFDVTPGEVTTVCAVDDNGVVTIKAQDLETENSEISINRMITIIDPTLAYQDLSFSRLNNADLIGVSREDHAVTVIKNDRIFELQDRHSCTVRYELNHDETLIEGQITCDRLEEADGSGRIEIEGDFSCDRRLF